MKRARSQKADPVGVGKNSALRDAIRDALSPQAVAAVANAVMVQVNSGHVKERGVLRELKWLGEDLIEMLGGGDAYRRACREAGL
jgi:hypothetical protein